MKRDPENLEREVQSLLQRWRTLALPVEEPERLKVRREQAVRTIASALRSVRRGRSRRHRLSWGLAVAAVAAAAVFGVVAVPRLFTSSADVSALAGAASDVYVLRVEGDVRARASGSHPEDGAETRGVVTSDVLARGSHVETGQASRAALQIGHAVRVELGPESTLLIGQGEANLQRVELARGYVELKVEPSERRRVVVHTPDARVVVHGTVFSVNTGEDDAAHWTTVRVSRGKVAVYQGGVRQALLKAGEQWSSRAESTGRTPSNVEAGREEGSAADAAGAADQSVARSAVVRRVASDRKQAESGSSLAEQNHLFQAALRARNRGDDHGCVTHLEGLLRRYPGTPLAQEAQVERFRALRRLGRTREAARSARRYLAEHEAGFARDEARNVALSAERESNGHRGSSSVQPAQPTKPNR